MNEIVYKFLLPEDKLMDQMNLKQSGFTCAVCRTLRKYKKVKKH